MDKDKLFTILILGAPKFQRGNFQILEVARWNLCNIFLNTKVQPFINFFSILIGIFEGIVVRENLHTYR